MLRATVEQAFAVGPELAGRDLVAKEIRPVGRTVERPVVLSASEDDVSDLQFGGRLVLRDGSAAADLVVDINQESLSLLQGEQVLGEYPLRDVQYLRWDARRVILSLAGENADFYPLRTDAFVATLDQTLESDHRRSP